MQMTIGRAAPLRVVASGVEGPRGAKAPQATAPLRKVMGVSATHDRQANRAVQWLATGVAAAAVSLSAAGPSMAIFNSGERVTDPSDALAAVVATQQSMDALRGDIEEMSQDCPAPTFSCDMSQLLKKSSGRVSGPLGRTLPTLIEELGADPYSADDVLAAMRDAEAILKSNNARIQVDWKGPVNNIKLASASLSQLLTELEPADVKAASARVAACDATVDPRLEGPLECRLVRAVYSKSLAPGIN